MRELQAGTFDRNRKDSLLLLRIQNSLNTLSLAMRDMLDSKEPYPLTAWRPQFDRLHTDLTDALAKEETYSPLDPSDSQRRFILQTPSSSSGRLSTAPSTLPKMGRKRKPARRFKSPCNLVRPR